MAYPNYFYDIKILIEKIDKLESDFKFHTTVKEFNERLKIENELGQCYRRLMNCTEKEGLQRVWIEHGVIQFMLINPDHSSPTNYNSL